MKKKQLAAVLLFITMAGTADAQLSAAAQLIYDSAQANNPGSVSYALSNQVQVLSTPDSASFYLQWFPAGAVPAETPLVVSLHGSKGNAFNEFKSWHPAAQSHQCGIIAIQYNKYTNVFDFINGYFNDSTIYKYIDDALKKISYPSNKALLHGFSLGSARTYAVIYNDIQSGNNYFCTTISNAGPIALNYPLYATLNTIPNVFQGKHWNLFCGPPEEPYTGGACEQLDFTQTWLQSKGAVVDIYLQDSVLGHNGFQQTTSEHYKDTMLNKYLECYGAPSGINEKEADATATIYPNPVSHLAVFRTTEEWHEATVLVYSATGVLMQEMHHINGRSVWLNCDTLPAGCYFVQLMQSPQNDINLKLVVNQR